MIEYKCLHVQKGSLLLPAADLEAFESGPREAMDQGAVDPLKVTLHTCRLSVFGADSRLSLRSRCCLLRIDPRTAKSGESA